MGDVTGECNGVTTGQDLNDSRSREQLLADASRAAREADMVIFIGGLNKSDNQDAEGADRLGFSLPYGQDEVIEALVDANPNTVVVSLTGNAYFYEPETRLWTIEPGRFEILIGNASDNILYNVAIDVDQPLTWKDSE